MEGKTGDGIWLHAVPDTISLNRGSKGCVVVRNNSIKELESFIKLGHTPIVILDKGEELAEPNRVKLKAELRDFVERWRTAWQHQDMSHFLNFYSTQFRGYGMNFSKWSRFKKRLADKNRNTKIEQKDFTILQFKNQFVVMFSQDFKSDRFKDEGDKILYIGEENGNLKIFSEEFLHEDESLKRASFAIK